MKVALAAGISPIVVDRGNGLNAETREFAAMAIEHGYAVELAEPDSSWWRDLRVLLKYKEFVDEKFFDAWAQKLAQSTRDDHRVPASTIRNWMQHWRHDLTVDQILHCSDTCDVVVIKGTHETVNASLRTFVTFSAANLFA